MYTNSFNLKDQQSPKEVVQWQNYEETISRIDPNFYARLLHNYPDVSRAELKICVLSRLNMGIKEMAGVLNLSENTVMNQRTRLRRKLNLTKTASLCSVMHSI